MKLNILYQFNEDYAPYAGVSIYSLLENNKNADEIDIYILGENLKQSSQKTILNLVNSYQRTVFFIDGEEIISFIKELGIPEYRGSYATNMKMFFPIYIGDTVERLLYIDSDTLVLGDLQPLFEKSMQKKPLEMALDSLAIQHKRCIGLSENEFYFNAGVMLIDVASWNANDCTSKIIGHVRNIRAHYIAPDQDILNTALKGMIGKLQPQYNLQPIHYRYPYDTYQSCWKQKNYYTRQELENAVNHPVILHFFRFLGEFPWNLNSQHPYAGLFAEYLEHSPWRDLKRMPSAQKGFVFQMERKLYHFLPDTVFMALFRVNYDFFLMKAERSSRKGQNYREM